MHRRTVGIDVDGVLCDLLTPAFKLAERMFGRHFHVDHMREWDLDALFEGDELDRFWTAVGQPGFHEQFEPYPESIAGVAMLEEIADVYIVTSPLHSATMWTFEREGWLKKYFGVAKNRVIHTAAKHMFSGDFLIDDKPANIVDYVKADPKSRQGILWHQPWNMKNAHFVERDEGDYEVGGAAYFRTRSWASVLRRAITGV